MAGWIKCTTTDGTDIRLNLDHVAMIRPYPDDRGFTEARKFCYRKSHFDHGHGETR